jgi:hypothetical protein
MTEGLSDSGACDGYDSSYGSMSTTRETSAEQDTRSACEHEVTIRSRTLFQRKATKLFQFDKEIPESTKHRFLDFRILFGKPLYDFLAKSNTNFGDVSMKLQCLGTSEETAKPWIIVQCEKSVVRKVKQFFNQDHVRAEYKPLDISSDRPHFDIHIYDRPPKRLNGNDGIVYGFSWDQEGVEPTLCGRPIRVIHSDGDRIATIGGVIKITKPGKAIELYAMTAGHSLCQRALEQIEVEYGASGDRETQNESSEYSFNEEELFELSEYPEEESDESETLDPNLPNVNQFPWSRIGHISYTSSVEKNRHRNMDWALMTIENLSHYRPNLLVELSRIRG